MRVIPKSTQRILGGGNAVRRTEPPSPARVEAGRKRSIMLQLVLTHGCGACCGAQHLQDGGKTLGCSILANPDSPPDERQAAEGCLVPEVYADVAAGRRETITAEEIDALVPVVQEAAETAAAGLADAAAPAQATSEAEVAAPLTSRPRER